MASRLSPWATCRHHGTPKAGTGAEAHQQCVHVSLLVLALGFKQVRHCLSGTP